MTGTPLTYCSVSCLCEKCGEQDVRLAVLTRLPWMDAIESHPVKFVTEP